MPQEPTPTPQPTARDLEAYFSGKTITIVVGFSPGGGYDTMSRVFALHAPRYFSGSPRFVVQNLPGAGGLRAVQEVTRRSPDALYTTPMANRFIAQSVMGDVEGFEMERTLYLGSPTALPDSQGFYVRQDVATSWDDVKGLGRTIVTGTSEPGGDMIGPQLAELLGEPVRVIFGYGGTSEVLAALDRRELDGTPRGAARFVMPLYPEWAEQRYIAPMFWWRAPIEDEWLQTLGVEQPPHIFDALNPNQEQRTAFGLADAIEQHTRMFILHPDTPADLADAWREAFKLIVEDQDFKTGMGNLGFAAGYTDPQELLDLIQAAAQFSSEARELFGSLYGLN